MLNYFLLLIALSLGLYAQSAEEQMAQIDAKFAAMKKAEDKRFKSYKENLDNAFKSYKKELNRYWKNPELSTKKEWVSYSKDKKSRSIVDFEKNSLVVEVIAKNKKEAALRLQKRVAYAISKDTQEVTKSDPLQKKIALISHESERVDANVDAKPILAPFIFKKKPTDTELKNYAKKIVKESKVVEKKSKIANEKLYKVTINLPKNAKIKRSLLYKDDVFSNANRFNLPPELLFAIMHTESDFNPFAKSHIPAFGLMQIVPRSAGRDTYRYLYKRDGMPTATYLYNSKNNIEMGSTYLYILYYRYLRKIKNPQSRLYCTIAAYNTGAGNIAWAFTHQTNMNRAAARINALSPKEVYEKLLRDLKYDEPKHYLKRVAKRMGNYKRAYRL